jgi:hypothetical protein
MKYIKSFLFVILFIFLIPISLLFSGIFQVNNFSQGDKLAFTISNKMYGQPTIKPFFALTEFQQEIEKIPKPLIPFLKMALINTPRPKKGLKFTMFSKKYKIVFNSNEDWEYFKKTALKILNKDRDMTFNK